MAEESNDIQVQPVDKSKINHIWRVALILAVITAAEFTIAFLLPASMTRNMVFILMTLVKAFYIVAEFMHLKHEVKVLAWSILIPLVFVVWLLVALLVEGGEVFSVRY